MLTDKEKIDEIKIIIRRIDYWSNNHIEPLPQKLRIELDRIKRILE